MPFPLHHKQQSEGAKIPKVNSQMQSGKLITTKDFEVITGDHGAFFSISGI